MLHIGYQYLCESIYSHIYSHGRSTDVIQMAHITSIEMENAGS